MEALRKPGRPKIEKRKKRAQLKHLEGKKHSKPTIDQHMEAKAKKAKKIGGKK
jgi:hypothetical protein